LVWGGGCGGGVFGVGVGGGCPPPPPPPPPPQTPNPQSPYNNIKSLLLNKSFKKFIYKSLLYKEF